MAWLVTDLADLYRLDDEDVIDLCTPAHLHFQQNMQVLAANKYVMVLPEVVDRQLLRISDVLETWQS